MKYKTPEMQVIKLEVRSVILTSFGNGGEGNPTTEPEITPKDDWS